VALPRGERLTLIKQIASALPDDFAEIELTLDTFEVPEPSHWENWGDNHDYALLRLPSATDEALVELHAHLHPDVSRGITPVAGGPWQEGYIKLFLTHTHPNKVVAKEVRDRLLQFGIDTFVAHEMIEPTKEWEEEIERALITCEALAALLTEDLVGSNYCDQEIGFALGRGIIVIPIRQQANPHGFIRKYQGVPGAGGPYAAWKIAHGIFDALVKNEKTKAKMGPAIAKRYSTSGSFDQARENTAYLLAMTKEMWTDGMVEEVERAGKENSQLDQGVWIPTNQRIPDLVSAHLKKLLDREPEKVTMADGAAGSDDIPF
jgi:hypothetical protein